MSIFEKNSRDISPQWMSKGAWKTQKQSNSKIGDKGNFLNIQTLYSPFENKQNSFSCINKLANAKENGIK